MLAPSIFLTLHKNWKILLPRLLESDYAEFLSDNCDLIHYPPVLAMLDLHWLYAASLWWLSATLPRAARNGNEQRGVWAWFAYSTSGASEWHYID